MFNEQTAIEAINFLRSNGVTVKTFSTHTNVLHVSKSFSSAYIGANLMCAKKWFENNFYSLD